MFIESIIWLDSVVDKLDAKHHVDPKEVEQVLNNHPLFRRIERGNVSGEDVYAAIGRTDGGRFLIIFFVYKQTLETLVISARDATAKERKQYGK